MSKLKFSENLFLNQVELQRFKQFLDDDGFRKILLSNSLKFGLVNKQYFQSSLTNEFLNGQITQASGFSIDYSSISAIDSDGNLITSASGNMPVASDNLWYWVKISFTYTSNEVGVVAIDANGNLTGDSNCKFLTTLVGQPDFPTRISFVGSTNNLLEYDVLEVIDDTNAVLDNSSFISETNLKYKVIGTFTPASVPLSADKEIFQYDSCSISLVAESVLNTRPTYVDGKEFFLARVKSNGVGLIIQDKRTQFWQTKSDFEINNLVKSTIPNFGIEKVKYTDTKSTLSNNIVYVNWCFRSTNYSINSNLNIVTINAGKGGKFKSVVDFSNGNFNGYRLYASDGSYSIIKSSIFTGGQINLYLDVLDVDKYSNDGGTTFTFNEIVVTPDSDEIEIIFKAQESDESNSASFVPHFDEIQLSDQRFVFPINSPLAKVELLAYDNPVCNYEVTYRLKNINQYSQEISMSSDTNFGYYSEIAFDSTGNFLSIVSSNSYAQNLAGGYIKTYSSNVIQLKMNPKSYSLIVKKVDLGNVAGLESRGLDATIQVLGITIGSNKEHQLIVASGYSLTQNTFIHINKLNVDGLALIDGNKIRLTLYTVGIINLNGFTLNIVTDYVSPSNYTLIQTISQATLNFMPYSNGGICWDIEYYPPTSMFYQNSQNEIQVASLTSSVNSNTSSIATNTSNIAIINDVWTHRQVLSTEMLANATDTFSPDTSAFPDPDTNNRIRYKVIGKTVFLDLRISKANFGGAGGGSVSACQIKLPAALTPVSTIEFCGSGWFTNSTYPGYDGGSGTEIGRCAIYIKAFKSTYNLVSGGNTISIGDPILEMSASSVFYNFYGSGANNILLQGQVIFEIE